VSLARGKAEEAGWRSRRGSFRGRGALDSVVAFVVEECKQVATEPVNIDE
jgi:hypothetical protein